MVTVNSNDGVTFVTLNLQRATIKESKRLKLYVGEIEEKLNQKIILDCSQIFYMDSTFLGAILRFFKNAISNGSEIRLVLPEMQTPVYTIFALTTMNKIMQIYPTLSEAMNSFNKEESVAV